LPNLNRYQPIGSTANFNFKTTRAVHTAQHCHINAMPMDTATWESSAAYRLESAAHHGPVCFYARNDGLGFTIPYEYEGTSHHYEPDFLVRLANGLTLIVEIKGFETDQDRAKHQAVRRWCAAVNNWGHLDRLDMHICCDLQTLEAELSAYL
jgi:type III restriction enzyme